MNLSEGVMRAGLDTGSCLGVGIEPTVPCSHLADWPAYPDRHCLATSSVSIHAATSTR